MDTQSHTESGHGPAKKPNGRFAKGNRASPGRPRGSKNVRKTLALAEAITVAELARLGRTPRQIARLLKARPSAVAEALAQSRRLLEFCAPQFAEHWLVASRVAAADGDHKPAMAALQSIDVVKPVAQTYDTGGPSSKATAAVQVQFLGFGFAGLPQPQGPPAIEVTTSERDPSIFENRATDPGPGPRPPAPR